MTDETKLGQVFTNPSVARLMVNLIAPYVKNDSYILDPCIGKNIFLYNADAAGIQHMLGMELDATLINDSTTRFFSQNGRKLIVGDFFDLPLEERFDFIIMNPPYIRQEILDAQKKMKYIEKIGCSTTLISKKSNLYIYFLVKAMGHLKENGRIVAILYDSWLYTDYGKKIKEWLINNYKIEKIIHFKKGAFEKVNVGATVVLIKKGLPTKDIEYYPLDSPPDLSDDLSSSLKNVKKINHQQFLDFHLIHSGRIEFDDHFFTPISSISSQPIKRGTGALVNKFFISDRPIINKYSEKIVKDVSKIRNFRLENETDYVLILPEENIELDAKTYLRKIEAEARSNPEKYQNMLNKLNTSKGWHVIKKFRGGNIIFNYYMRHNIHFIFNPDHLHTSDNFYNLYTNENVLENFAILNSSFTKYALLKYSKTQGRGLFKIQLSQFVKIPMADVNQFQTESKEKLRELALSLFNTERKKPTELIERIDAILIQEYNRHTRSEIDLEILAGCIDEILG